MSQHRKKREMGMKRGKEGEEGRKDKEIKMGKDSSNCKDFVCFKKKTMARLHTYSIYSSTADLYFSLYVFLFLLQIMELLKLFELWGKSH